jgi:mono/diheme cytochrome c family protein
MGKFLLGVILGIILIPAAVAFWLADGKPPVAVADPPLPEERMITSVPLHARIDREMPPVAPIADIEENLVAGAQIYRDQCSDCHGYHGKPSRFGPNMYPAAPPLWEKHATSEVVGVSDDPVGETYWKVANGIRLTGMPSFQNTLTPTQIWQVSLLLADANKPLPPAALNDLRGPASTPQSPAESKAAAKP